MSIEEIRGRLEAANAELDRLTSGNPGTNWRWSIPADPERDSDLIFAAALDGNARLLNAVEAVLGQHQLVESPDGDGGFLWECSECGYEPDGQEPCPTVQCITTALEAES